ncbi:SDR family oxidoreductase [Rhizobium sp. Nf11,1]|uniref:SDR family oxidoreductase n=1 Tax=unclassified Rhizobium TaxID=2613769 RepID=UPI003D324B06
MSRHDDVLAFCTLLDKGFSQIGVLVNNAGIGPTMAATVDTPIQDFQSAPAVNLIGPYWVACEIAKLMKPGAAIVNVASLAGLLGNPKRNGYAASKAALISITKTLACAGASRGIRVTVVAPVYVHTPMVAELETAGKLDVRAIRRGVPIGRLARPDEIARAVHFMASEQASYITGSTLVVDGGWMSFSQPREAHRTQGRTPGVELLRPVEDTDARTVVVIDGAKGIGAAIARRFAARGDTVVIADGGGGAAVKLADLLGDKHLSKRVERTVESDVVALFEELRKRSSHIDVFVNGLGVNAHSPRS